jgi:hypothetical protein
MTIRDQKRFPGDEGTGSRDGIWNNPTSQTPPRLVEPILAMVAELSQRRSPLVRCLS